jgi:hypothetical protein
VAYPKRTFAAPLLAAAAIALLYALARPADFSSHERAATAARFRFVRAALPEIAGPPVRFHRALNPSVAGLEAFISSLGAAVALYDLDGDGLPNDVCFVDTRTDQVLVAPAPTTGPRFAPFALPPAPLPAGTSSAGSATAPMGCLPADLNEDGLADLLVYSWGRTPVAYLRTGERLDANSWAPVELVPGGGDWYSNAAVLADVDGDGHPDIVLGNYFPDGSRVLDARAAQRMAMPESLARARNGGGVRFLLWQGGRGGPRPDVRYVEAHSGPDILPRGWTLAIGAQDLDGDLLPEIYLANDFGPDRLLHNRSAPGRLQFARLEGRKTLTVSSSKVLGRDSFKGMGVDFADLNGDGIPDIFVSNIAFTRVSQEQHFAFVSTGQAGAMASGRAPYVDRSEALGLAWSGWGWDAKFADFDNDGVLELLQAAGMVQGQVPRWPEILELAMGNPALLVDPRVWPRVRPGDELSGWDPNAFFVRASNGRYADVAAQLGIKELQVSRGVAVADVDGDGRLDFAVANQWAPSSFYRNECADCGAFLGLHLLLPIDASGGQPNGLSPRTWSRPGHPAADTPGRPALGASVTVRLPDGRRLLGQVDGGNGHSGKRAPDLHFGLAEAAPGALAVEVAWRDAGGTVRHATLQLDPGWHTVVLGAAGHQEPGT